jgi:hypothetical protein
MAVLLAFCVSALPAVAEGQVYIRCYLGEDLVLHGEQYRRNELITIDMTGYRGRDARSPPQVQNLLNAHCATRSLMISIDGEITGRVADAFVALVRELVEAKPDRRALTDALRTSHVVHVNSPGGDVEAALRIGEKVRQIQAGVVVAADAACRSACVFILAAGVTRYVDGVVEVHRPFFQALPARLSQAAVADAMRRGDERLRSYLSGMNVPDGLLDRMRAVPPNRIERLSRRELSQYLLAENDPVYDERITARAASLHGVTSMEYRRRAALGERLCFSGTGGCTSSDCLHRGLLCQSAILYGLSEQTYESRRSEVDRVCSSIFLSGTLTAATADAFDACERQIMLR